MKKQDVAKKMNIENHRSYFNMPKGKKSQKGKMSLNSVGKNEGENMMMGKNNTQRA